MTAAEKAAQQFEIFHAANPHVWKLIERFALEAISKGIQHFGINAIIERARWEWHVETKRTDPFKINNNHAPFYSRLFEQTHPRHDGFFRQRKSGADRPSQSLLSI